MRLPCKYLSPSRCSFNSTKPKTCATRSHIPPKCQKHGMGGVSSCSSPKFDIFSSHLGDTRMGREGAGSSSTNSWKELTYGKRNLKIPQKSPALFPHPSYSNFCCAFYRVACFAIFLPKFFRQRMNIAKYREPSFIGFGNYIELLQDQYFIEVIKNTLSYILGTVPISIILALFFAIMVNRKVRNVGLLRLAFFHPMVLPMVSAATIWLFFFTPNYGLFNSTLRFLGYSGAENWTGNPDLALLAVIIVSIWKNSGYYMIWVCFKCFGATSRRLILSLFLVSRSNLREAF